LAIRIAPLVASDKTLFIALCTNQTIMQYVYTPLTVTQASKLFAERLVPWHHKSSGWLSYTLVETVTEKKVGTIGLKIIDHQAAVAEVGFMMLSDAQGKGYASQALGLLCKQAFSVLNLHKLVAVCAAENSASVALLQKQGFQLEERLKNNTEINGVFVDDLRYGLVNNTVGNGYFFENN